MWPTEGKPISTEGHLLPSNMTDPLNPDKHNYDSHIDSGFLSGSNLLSSSTDEYSRSEPLSPSNLDSGVDISEQLGSLQLKTQGEELAVSRVEEPGFPPAEEDNSPAIFPPGLPVALIKEIFTPDSDGDTQLHVAVMRGFVEVVHQITRLLPHQAFLDLANNRGKTALHLAVSLGSAPLARHLLVSGASPVSRDLSGDTPLHLAARLRQPALLPALLRPPTRPEVTSARLPFLPRHTSAILAADMKNYSGETCMHVAASAGNEDVLHTLTQLGADVNAREGLGGRTALHLAVEAGNTRLIAHLVSGCRASLHTLTYAKLTPYQLALANGRTDLATFLLSLGAPALMLPERFLASDSETDSEAEDSYLVEQQSPAMLEWNEVDDVHLAGMPVMPSLAVSTAPHNINADIY